MCIRVDALNEANQHVRDVTIHLCKHETRFYMVIFQLSYIDCTETSQAHFGARTWQAKRLSAWVDGYSGEVGPPDSHKRCEDN